jgi:hypothetical protein
MSLSRRGLRINPTADFAHPKPTRTEKHPRGLKRSGPIERRRRRHIARNVQHAGYLKWLHEQRCCETGRYGTKYDRIDANHVNHELGGVGLKAPDYYSFPLLHSLHMQWTRHEGFCDGWTKVQRREYAEFHLGATHNRWLALPEDVRDGYQAAALAEREAMRDQRRAERAHTPKRCTKPGCTKHPHGVIR